MMGWGRSVVATGAVLGTCCGVRALVRPSVPPSLSYPYPIRIVSRGIVSYRVVSLLLSLSYRVVPCSYRIVFVSATVSRTIVSHRSVSCCIVSYRIVSCCIVSYTLSYRIRIVSRTIVSHCIVSHRIVSYPYRIVSVSSRLHVSTSPRHPASTSPRPHVSTSPSPHVSPSPRLRVLTTS